MASYPATIYSPRTKENANGVVYDAAKTTIGYAEDVTKLDDEVVAIENELGLNPSGDYDTVAERLDDMGGGGGLGGSGTTNYLAKFTDTGTLGDSIAYENATEFVIDLGPDGQDFKISAGFNPDLFTIDESEAKIKIIPGFGVTGHDIFQNHASSVFNASKGDFNFTVHGDAVDDLIHVDASADRVGIQTNAPDADLDIQSDDISIKADSEYYIPGIRMLNRSDFTALPGVSNYHYLRLVSTDIGVTFTATAYYEIPVPKLLYNRTARLTGVTFYYYISNTSGTIKIDENVLYRVDCDSTTTEDIDNDTTDITSTGSHACSNLPANVPSASVDAPSIFLSIKIVASSWKGTFYLYGIKYTFDSD